MTGQHALRQVRVVYRKQVSDGNYGTEAAEITFEDYCEADDDDLRVAEILFHRARNAVHAELLRSPSLRVQQSVEPPKVTVARPPRPSDPEDDDEDLPY